MLPILGAQLEGALEDRIKYAVAQRTYHIPIRWDEVEINPGVFVFPPWIGETINSLNAKLGTDYKMIMGVKCCPPFYAIQPYSRNSPPQPQYYGRYASFVDLVYKTYRPFGIEIWNEPEFPIGGENDEYYGGFGEGGGAVYGRLVRHTYNYLRSRFSPVKVIAGASYGCVDVDKSLQFLKDAVAAGMKSHYWSWHGYVDYYNVVSGTDDFYKLLWFSNEAYKYYRVPQILSETSVLRYTELPEEPNHRDRQAKLLEFLLRRLSTSKIESILWYTLADNAWKHCSMIMGNIEYPVYQVWRDA